MPSFQRNSAKSEPIVVMVSGEDVSSIVLQVQGNTWTGTLTLATRVTGTTLPFINCPYQNLITLADVAAGTTITGPGQFAVRTDGLDLQVTHAWAAGNVDLGFALLGG
jgi:hypothetical protein